MKFLAIMCTTLLLSTSLFAETLDWDLFDKAFSTKATYQETQFGYFATLKKTESINDSLKVNYFSAIGGFDENKNFIASRYELVFENWKKVGETLHIDQWLFVLNTDHVLTFKLHRKMIQKFDATVLLLENVDEADESFDSKSLELLNFWTQMITSSQF